MGQAWAAKNGYYIHPQTGQIIGNGDPGMMEKSAREMRGYGISGAGPHHTPFAPVALDDRYHNLGLATPAERGSIRAARGIAKGQAISDTNRMNHGHLSMQERATFSLPGYANSAMQHATSQGWMDAQGQQFMAKLAADQQNNQWGHAASMISAIPQLVQSGSITPTQGQQMMNHAMGLMGMGGAGGGTAATPGGSVHPMDRKMRDTLPPAKLAEFHGLPDRAARDRWMNSNGITDPQLRTHMHRQAAVGQPGIGPDGLPLRPGPPGMWGSLGNAIQYPFVSAYNGLWGPDGFFGPPMPHPTRRRGPNGRSEPIPAPPPPPQRQFAGPRF
jgi:hypothetical protein